MSPFASWKLAATPPAPLPKEALVAMDDFFPTHPKRRPGRPVACRGPRGAADGAEYPGPGFSLRKVAPHQGGAAGSQWGRYF